MNRFVIVFILGLSSAFSYADLLIPNPFERHDPASVQLESLLTDILGGKKKRNHTVEAFGDLLRVDYGSFKLTIDCASRQVISFTYLAPKSTSGISAMVSNPPARIFRDVKIPARCQQTSTFPYDKGFERGYIVPPHLIGHDESASEITTLLPNILPVVKNNFLFDEAQREIDYLRSFGDVVVNGFIEWDNSKPPLKLHGIAPPAYFLVSVKTATSKGFTWRLPNESTQRSVNLVRYKLPDNVVHLKTKSLTLSTDGAKNAL